MALNLFSLIGACTLAHAHSQIYGTENGEGEGEGGGPAAQADVWLFYLFHWDAEIQAHSLHIKQNPQHAGKRCSVTTTLHQIPPFFLITSAFKEKHIYLDLLNFFFPLHNKRIAHICSLNIHLHVSTKERGYGYPDVHGVQLHDAQSYNQNRRIHCWIISSLLDQYGFKIVSSKSVDLWKSMTFFLKSICSLCEDTWY